MRRALALTFALAAAFAGCRKPPPKKTGPVEYRAADGSFTARLPGDWKADDSPGESRKIAIFGPPSGKTPFSDLMGVYYHPSADPTPAARSYVASQTGQGPGLGPTLGGDAAALDSQGDRSVHDLHSGRDLKETTRIVAVVVPGGFYTLEHTWPSEQAPDAAFDELVTTFKPGPAAK